MDLKSFTARSTPSCIATTLPRPGNPASRVFDFTLPRPSGPVEDACGPHERGRVSCVRARPAITSHRPTPSGNSDRWFDPASGRLGRRRSRLLHRSSAGGFMSLSKHQAPQPECVAGRRQADFIEPGRIGAAGLNTTPFRPIRAHRPKQFLPVTTILPYLFSYLRKLLHRPMPHFSWEQACPSATARGCSASRVV
jgi:hypothetical protein